MGAHFYFDEVLPALGPTAQQSASPRRQVQVFRHGGRLCLRMRQLGKVDQGEGFCVELSRDQATALFVGLDEGMSYLWGSAGTLTWCSRSKDPGRSSRAEVRGIRPPARGNLSGPRFFCQTCIRDAR